MSLLNSKFDIISVENTLAVAALAQVLEVGVFADPNNPLPAEVRPLYTGTSAPGDFSGGTPLQGGVTLLPGTVVMLDQNGKAVLATCPVLDALDKEPILPFVTIDGNTDYSGKFVRKVTVFQGGFTMATDQFDLSNGGTFVPGKPVTAVSGKVVPRSGADAERQIYGFIGAHGLDTMNGVLEVIVPQGAGF